jgi:predicted ATP-grasp superfamily ATP-dependent carboligase
VIENFDENVRPSSAAEIINAINQLSKAVVSMISTDTLEKELERRKRTTG